MFVRFVRLQVREGAAGDFKTFYEEKVIPALQATDGCLFAGLLQPWQGQDHQSFTIWESPDHARAYEESGLYHSLLRGAEPMLSSSTSWQVRLGSDPEETLDRERREIPPEGYTVEVGDGTEGLDAPQPSTYVRIVSIRVAEGRLADFRAVYEKNVLPVLKERPGCRGAFLAEGIGERNEFLSISLWDREESAVRYEMSGEFDRLTYTLQDMFSRVHEWRMSLDSPGEGALDAPDVEGYHFVTARKL